MYYRTSFSSRLVQVFEISHIYVHLQFMRRSTFEENKKRRPDSAHKFASFLSKIINPFDVTKREPSFNTYFVCNF